MVVMKKHIIKFCIIMKHYYLVTIHTIGLVMEFIFGKTAYQGQRNGLYHIVRDITKKNPEKQKKEPAVIGAVISLGYCLNLTDYGSSEILKNGYEILSYELSLIGQELPINKHSNGDILLRELDCAVIERIHQYNKELGKRTYDSVRGIFIEGTPVYRNSGIMEKTHVQLCIVNPNCIKGYFKPLTPNSEWNMV